MQPETPSPFPLPDMPCVILAGGRSRRFGSDKAFAELGGHRLIDIIVQKLAAQTAGPVAVNAANTKDYADLSLPLLPDRLRGHLGPLAGLHAALCWAETRGYAAVITTPVDTPLLPIDFVSRLMRGPMPVVAGSCGRAHPLHGIWPTALHTELAVAVQDGMRAARDWQTACDAQLCDFPDADATDPFANINRPEELADLQKFEAGLNPHHR